MIDYISPFQKMVHDFNTSISAEPDVELRIKLIQEEAEEFSTSVLNKDVAECLDALCDILYVTYGAADVFGHVLNTRTTEQLSGRIGLRVIKWAKIRSELHDFVDCVGIVVTELRLNPKSGISRNRLEDLANGCWKAASLGFEVDLKAFFREVHRTNMHKLTGPKRADGKQLKPEGWMPPRIDSMLMRLTGGQIPECPIDCLRALDQPDFDVIKVTRYHEGGLVCVNCGGFVVD